MEPYLRNLLAEPGYNFRDMPSVDPYLSDSSGYRQRQFFKVNIEDVPVEGHCNITLHLQFKKALEKNIVLLFWFTYKKVLKFDNSHVRNVEVQ